MLLTVLTGFVAAAQSSPSTSSPPSSLTPPSQLSEIETPASCRGLEEARLDQVATMNGMFFGNMQLGPRGRRYMADRDKLSAAMKAANPDLDEIARMWRALDQQKVEIARIWLTLQTQCTLDKVKTMPPEERRRYLRMMAPMTKEDRDRLPIIRPVAPPPVQPTLPSPKL